MQEGLRGGNWEHGLLMGAVSGAGGAFLTHHGRSLGKGGMIVANAVLSGTVSEIGGGKFANGAITGAFAVMFNDLMHPTDDLNQPDDEKKRIKENEIAHKSGSIKETILKAAIGLTTVALSDDISVIGCADDILIPIIWVGVGVSICAINIWNHFSAKSDISLNSNIHYYKEHKKGARPSTKAKHQIGQARKQKDKIGGEKGDVRRKKYK